MGGVAGTVAPSEMGPGHIFPGATQQDLWPATDKLMLRWACKHQEVPSHSGMGWARESYSCPAQKWDGQQLLYLLRKDKQCPGALRGRELPWSPSEGAHFSKRASLVRMLCNAGCHRAARSSRSSRDHQCHDRMRGSFSGDACREAGEPRSSSFSLQRDVVK